VTLEPSGRDCRDVAEFNRSLLSWLAESSAGTFGGSHEEVVLTVVIGGVRCTLRGDTTRAGVAAYLDTFLTASSGPFSVVASSAA
jgi:hypothetical protein